MKHISIIAYLSFAIGIFAQNSIQKKADYNYTHLNFWLAKNQYKRLIKSNPNGVENIIKLSICYKQLHENEKGYLLLSQLVAKNQLSTSFDFELFGQLCLLTKRYEEADASFKKQRELKITSGAINNEQQTILSKERLTWKSEFELNSLLINSTKADFGGYPYLNGSIMFLSNRGNHPIKRKWAGNGENFLDLYLVKTKDKVVRFKSHFVNKFHEGPLCMHPNGKWVYFTRNNISAGKARKDSTGIQQLKLYRAEIKSNGKWTNIKSLNINSNEFSVAHPSISSDGKMIFFSSDMPGGFGGADLYIGNMTTEGEITEIRNLGASINTSGNEVFSWFHENQLFFASDGLAGLGGLDIQVSKMKQDGQFSKPKNIGSPINTNADDFALIFHTNDTGYLSSNRSGFGSDDIYAFKMIEPIKWLVSISGNVREIGTTKNIANQLLIIYNKNGNVLDTITSDEKGLFNLELNEGDEITIHSPESRYEEGSWNYIASNDENQILDLEVSAHPNLLVNTKITDKISGVPVENVSISIKDKNSGRQIILGETNVNGLISDSLNQLKKGQELSFEITLSKPGYLDKTVAVSYTVTKSETINIHELIDLGIGKINVGTNLAELIDLNPIYFDLGKFTIRPDAAIELDKIVGIMNQYPQMIIELGSHTDCRSSKAFNLKLSQNRAKASADYIKARITNPTRISGVGYGESKLKVNCPCEGKVVSTCPEEDHAKNRRTEFIVKKVK